MAAYFVLVKSFRNTDNTRLPILTTPEFYELVRYNIQDGKTVECADTFS